VLCMLFSKDKRQSQDETGQSSTDKVQERTEKKNPTRGMVVVSVVCCQVEVSATGRSFVQRSPTDCGCECDQMNNK
jgi:hypothetical protein